MTKFLTTLSVNMRTRNRIMWLHFAGYMAALLACFLVLFPQVAEFVRDVPGWFGLGLRIALTLITVALIAVLWRMWDRTVARFIRLGGV